MKVLLLTAPRPMEGYSPVHFGDNRPPQGLGYIAAYLVHHGHEAEIVDLYAFGGSRVKKNVSVSQEEIGDSLDIDIDQVIKEFSPEFIGMYVHTMSFESACELSLRLKKAYPDIQQVCGGPHPSIKQESMPLSFDYVVAGEGEFAMLDIVEGRVTERMVSGKQMTSSDIENLPWPDFDHFWGKPYNFKLKLFNKDIEPVLTISTSRGCPFRCKFCGAKEIYPRYANISADHVFNRMVELRERYGVDAYYFREDNFTANLTRLRRFCELIIGSGIPFKWVCESRVRELSPEMITMMAKSGCIGLYIGCESGSNRVLKLMQKDETVEDYMEKFPLLHENGISTYTTWVYGTPGERSEDRHMTDEIIRKLGPTEADRFVYIGIPRSECYDEIIQEKAYEFIDQNGFMYPNGYLSLSRALYGIADPRVTYVDRLYREHGITPVEKPW